MYFAYYIVIYGWFYVWICIGTQSSIFSIKNYHNIENLIIQDKLSRNSFVYKQTHGNIILKLSSKPGLAFVLCV